MRYPRKYIRYFHTVSIFNNFDAWDKGRLFDRIFKQEDAMNQFWTK